MNIAGFILKIFGWKVTLSVPDVPKCIYCVAPHTSNWDFILCELAILSVGRSSGFLMKSTWFFFPLGCFFKAIGGIPVVRSGKKGGSLVDSVVERFKQSPKLHIAITPEGTRKLTTKWHTGFLRIARQADVPIYLAVIDGETKHIFARDVFYASDNADADIKKIKKFYSPYTGIRRGKFSAE